MAMIQLAAKYAEALDSLGVTMAAEAKAVTAGAQGADVTQHFGITGTTAEETRKGFLRQELEKEYQELYTKKELLTDKGMSLAFQSDILAGLEKAYTMRHRRRLDYLVSGVARAQGLSSDKGLLKHALKTIPLNMGTKQSNG